MFHNPGVLGMHVFVFFQSVQYIPINTTLGQEESREVPGEGVT